MSAGTVSRPKGTVSVDNTPALDWMTSAVKTTVGTKFVVAITGLLLVGFLIAHFAGNSLIFKGRDAINAYARGLRDLGWLLWAARIGLLTIFAVHVFLGIKLNLRNKAARPDKYQHPSTLRASLASRTMLLSGLVILAFAIYHLAHYTFTVVQMAPSGQNFHELVQTGWNPHDPTEPRADVYNMVVYGFSNVWISASYIIAQLILGLHLSHGIASTMQTLGWNSPKYWPMIRNLGWLVTAIIVIGNMTIPVAVLMGRIPPIQG